MTSNKNKDESYWYHEGKSQVTRFLDHLIDDDEDRNKNKIGERGKEMTKIIREGTIRNGGHCKMINMVK